MSIMKSNPDRAYQRKVTEKSKKILSQSVTMHSLDPETYNKAVRRMRNRVIEEDPPGNHLRDNPDYELFAKLFEDNDGM